MLFRLGDIGVVADHLTSSRKHLPGSSLIVRYDSTAYVITPKKEITIHGILLTPLGESIPAFYEPQWNSSGCQVTTDWIASLTPELADVQEAKIQESNTGA